MSSFPYAEESLLALDGAAVSSFKALMNHCDVASLTSAIARLEAREQLVLALIYFEEFATADVAHILDFSVVEASHLHALAVLALHRSHVEGRAYRQSKANM